MKSLLCLLFSSMAFCQELSLPEYRLPTAQVVEHEPGPDDSAAAQDTSQGAWYRLVLRMLEALESSQTQVLESMLDSGFDRQRAALGILSAWRSQKSRYGSFKELRQLGGRKVEYLPEITGILNFDRGKTGLKVTLSYFEPRHIVKVEFLHPPEP